MAAAGMMRHRAVLATSGFTTVLAEQHGLQVRFKHRDTGGYLYSHEMRFGNPIAGQNEVCGIVDRRDKNSEWMAAEGVYLPNAAAVAGKDATAEQAAASEADSGKEL